MICFPAVALCTTAQTLTSAVVTCVGTCFAGYLSLPKRSGKIRDISKCDFEFFGLTEHEANYMDVQMRLALETTYEAVADAGLDPAQLRGTKTAIFAGICYDDTGTAYCQDEHTAQHYLRFSIQKVAAAFDFRGGASATDTACASSFSAFYQAFYSLKAGLCDQALVVGAAVNLRPTIALGFNNLRMTSQDGRSKCMDASGESARLCVCCPVPPLPPADTQGAFGHSSCFAVALFSLSLSSAHARK